MRDILAADVNDLFSRSGDFQIAGGKVGGSFEGVAFSGDGDVSTTALALRLSSMGTRQTSPYGPQRVEIDRCPGNGFSAVSAALWPVVADNIRFI